MNIIQWISRADRSHFSFLFFFLNLRRILGLCFQASRLNKLFIVNVNILRGTQYFSRFIYCCLDNALSLPLSSLPRGLFRSHSRGLPLTNWKHFPLPLLSPVLRNLRHLCCSRGKGIIMWKVTDKHSNLPHFWPLLDAKKQRPIGHVYVFNQEIQLLFVLKWWFKGLITQSFLAVQLDHATNWECVSCDHVNHINLH